VSKYRPKLAVFFDAENLSLKCAASILQRLSGDWDIHLRRAYGSNFVSQEEILLQLSIIPVEVLRNTKSKNSVDMALALDATEELCLGISDGICIVSGDSDFTRLMQRIREKGKTAIAFGNSNTPISLRNACTNFYSIASSGTEDGTSKADPKVRAPKVGVAAKSPKVALAPKLMTPELARDLRRDLRRVFQEFRSKSGGDALGQFGQFLCQRYPQLQQQNFGFGHLRTLLAKVGGFHITPVHRDNGVIGGYRLSLTKDDVGAAADEAEKPTSTVAGKLASRVKRPSPRALPRK
jgi:hypothetical protein